MSEHNSSSYLNLSAHENNFQEGSEKQTFKVYKYRFVIVFLFVLQSLSVSFQQNTFVPEASTIASLYSVSSLEVTMTSVIHMLLYTPVCFPASYVVDKYGCRIGVLFCALFMITGCWLRLFINQSFAWALVGSFFVGLANPFSLNVLTKISAIWFFPEDRQTVTTVLSFISTITGPIGTLMPGLWFGDFSCDNCTSDQIEIGQSKTFSLILCQAIIITAFNIPIIFLFQNKPVTPPSYSASIVREDFKKSLSGLVKNRGYILLFISYGIFYGIFFTLIIVLSFVIEPFGVTKPIQVAIIGISPILTGIAGNIFFVWMLKKSNKYKQFTMICQFALILCMLLFLALLGTGSFALYLVVGLAVGFFIVPVIPIMLEFGCEICFPIGEGTTTGFLYAGAHIIAAVCSVFFGWLINGKSKQDSRLGMGLFALFFAIGTVLTYFIKEDLKRLKAEQQQLASEAQNEK